MCRNAVRSVVIYFIKRGRRNRRPTNRLRSSPHPINNRKYFGAGVKRNVCERCSLLARCKSGRGRLLRLRVATVTWGWGTWWYGQQVLAGTPAPSTHQLSFCGALGSLHCSYVELHFPQRLPRIAPFFHTVDGVNDNNWTHQNVFLFARPFGWLPFR